MHKARACVFVCAGLFLLALTGLDAAPVLGEDHAVGAATGGDYAIIIMAEGDIFTTWIEGGRACDFPPHPWVLQGNVFSSAGRGAPGPVVGVNQNYQVLAANGDWFQLSGSWGSATFLGNVFDQTGVRVPGEEFVMFGAGANGSNEYAATKYGNVYRWDGCAATTNWSYIGTLPGSPTAAVQPSWGTLKMIYR